MAAGGTIWVQELERAEGLDFEVRRWDDLHISYHRRSPCHLDGSCFTCVLYMTRYMRTCLRA